MRKKLWAILVLTTLVASILVGCSEECGSTLTILSISEGSVLVMEEGTDSWEEAQVGMSLELGDSIKTGSNSSAEITFFDGSTIELQAGTEIEIISLDISADCSSTTITLEQTMGTTISRVVKLLDPASRYEVETPTGVAVVRGSSMLVQVFPDGSARVTNLAGEIVVTGEGVELQIPEGQPCITRPDEPPQIMPGVYFLTITSTSGGNVIMPGEGTFTYEEGTVVSLVAEADEDYEFVNWDGDVDTIAEFYAATTTITMSGDYSITAKFVMEYDLTISSTAGGSVTTPGEGTYIYDEGTVVGLVVEADEGYQFVNWTGDVDTIADVYATATTITMDDNYSITANFQYIPLVAAGYGHTAGVKSDGTVVAVGWNYSGECDVGGWTDIFQVAAGWYHTVGVKSDGTVVAVGVNAHGRCDVGGWTDITQVAAGGYHTVGLESGGTFPVVAVGSNYYGQCNVGTWTDIAQVAAGCLHTVGVKNDGTVVAVGNNSSGQCDVGGWTDIVQVAAGEVHTVGLESGGTVVAVGYNQFGQRDVGGWTDIIQVAAGTHHTVGLKDDGTVVAVGDNRYGQRDIGGWTDIIQVAAGGFHTVGLESDGTVVTVGWNVYGQCDVGGWDLIP